MSEHEKGASITVNDVYGWDYDGAIAGLLRLLTSVVEICGTDKQKKLHKVFQKMYWDHVASQPKSNKRFGICMSARQDIGSDLRNFKTNHVNLYESYYKNWEQFSKLKPIGKEGSVFYDLQRLSSDPKMNAKYLPFLFADEEGKPGSASINPLLTIEKKERELGVKFDDRKITLVRSQISKLHDYFPEDEQICLKIFDDREDILRALADLRTELPENMSLELYKYDWNDCVMDCNLEVGPEGQTPVLKQFC